MIKSVNFLIFLMCTALLAFQARAEESEDLEAQIRAAEVQLREAAAQLHKLRSELATGEELQHIMGRATRPRIGLLLREDGDGVAVASVTPGSPAAEAGIQSGDRLISIGGADASMASDPSTRKVTEIIAEAGPDTPLFLGMERDGEALEFTVTPRVPSRLLYFHDMPGRLHHWMEEYDVNIDPDEIMKSVDQAFQEGFEHVPRAISIHKRLFSPIHLQLSENSPELGEYFGTTEGVLVLKPDERHDIGLKAGDVILRLNGAGLGRPGDFYSELAALETGDIITLEIMRHGQLEILEAEVPEGHGLGMLHPRVKVLRRDGV